MVATSLTRDSIEDVIRTVALTKRIRPSEFFLDYDRLRSGFVSATQFFRCLWVNLGLKFTPEEERLLSFVYDAKGNGRINWRQFAESIEKHFNSADLGNDPTAQKVDAPEFLGTERSVRPLSPSSEKKIEQTLLKLIKWFRYHGINLRTCYEDFDVHHIGRISESQFYRSFPGPADISEEEKTLLVRKYADPNDRALVVYLNLHHDIVALSQNLGEEYYLEEDAGARKSGVRQDAVEDPTLQQIFDKIRVAVFKNGIRTPEFFRDYDSLRSGVVTENQFVCGLSLAAGKEARLNRAEIQKVVEYYKQPDGRVRYKEFCDMMENAFNLPDLDKKATQTPSRPPEGALNRTLPSLSEAEEIKLDSVLAEIRDQVKRRRLMMYQYFKDYDRSRAYTRVMTASQFRRMLHFLTINVGEEDFKLLCRKFVDEATGDVNYPAFVQSVDQEFVGFEVGSGQADDCPLPGTDGGRITLSDAAVKPIHKGAPTVPSGDTSNMADLMARIRSHVLANRLRVIEYFQDYDPLRCGSITKTQFRRALSQLGLSKLGQHDLTDAQYTALCTYYESPKLPEQVLWTKFMDDVESVFTQPNLEQKPTHQVPPSEIFRTPPPGTLEWSAASPDHAQLVAQTMERLGERVGRRRVMPRPTFQDFDPHNNGHVTRVQFRQCLSILELPATEAEMAAIEAKYCDDIGFNYIRFVTDLEPKEPTKFMYVERLQNVRQANQAKRLGDIDVTTDFEALLLKLKSKVARERIRVHEWMRDYDKLRSGRMHKTSFRRALDLCKFELRESEIAMIEDKFKSQIQDDYVDWLRFSDEIESIFTTKELEKAPLLEVQQFKLPTDWERNELSDEDNALCSKALQRLADKVRQRRIQLFPLFEDYDRVHNGFVSRSQFFRVVNELELSGMLSELEQKSISTRFRVKKGLRDDFDYLSFCDFVYSLCGFEWRKP